MRRAVWLGVVLASVVSAQGWRGLGPSFGFSGQVTAQDGEYQHGLDELESHEWDKAAASFRQSASRGRANADGALYWMAYAQAHEGDNKAALATLRLLRSKFPASRWLKDAQALEWEAKAAAGVAVQAGANANPVVKLMAANNLAAAHPGAAVPVIEQVLDSSDSERTKEQALFVLAQTPSPEASKMLTRVAFADKVPAMQLQAIRLMGALKSKQADKSLASLYTLSSDTKVKDAILQSFAQAGSLGFLARVAKEDLNPQLRRQAVQQLGQAQAGDQLWRLYHQGLPTEERKAILHSFQMSGNSNRLLQVAQQENDPALRAAAIGDLAVADKGSNTDLFLSIFRTAKDAEVRTAVLDAFSRQENGRALVTLARSEKNPRMKAQIIGRMAVLNSKVVTDYLANALK